MERLVAVAWRDYGIMNTDKTGGSQMQVNALAPESVGGQSSSWAAQGVSGYVQMPGLLALLPYARVAAW